MFGAAQFLGGMPGMPGAGFGSAQAHPQPQAQSGTAGFMYHAPKDINEYLNQVMLYNTRMFQAGAALPLQGPSFTMGSMGGPATTNSVQQPMSGPNSGNLNMSGPLAGTTTSAPAGMMDPKAPSSQMPGMPGAWPPGLFGGPSAMFPGQADMANLGAMGGAGGVGGMAGLPPGLTGMENPYASAGAASSMLGFGTMPGQVGGNPLGVLPLMGNSMTALHNAYLGAAGLLKPMQVPGGTGMPVSAASAAAGMSMSMPMLQANAMLQANSALMGNLPLGMGGLAGGGIMAQVPTQQQPPPQQSHAQPGQLTQQLPPQGLMQGGMGMDGSGMAGMPPGLPPLAMMNPGLLAAATAIAPNGGGLVQSNSGLLSPHLMGSADLSKSVGASPGLGGPPSGWVAQGMPPQVVMPLAPVAQTTSGRKSGRSRGSQGRSEERDEDALDSVISSAEGDEATSDMDDPGSMSLPRRSGNTARGTSMGMHGQHMPEVTEKEAKKLKRKQSNRDSARRSRLRKQAELNDVAGLVGSMNDSNEKISAQVAAFTRTAEQLDAANAVLRELLNVVRSHQDNTGGGMPSPNKLQPFLDRLKLYHIDDDPVAADLTNSHTGAGPQAGTSRTGNRGKDMHAGPDNNDEDDDEEHTAEAAGGDTAQGGDRYLRQQMQRPDTSSVPMSNVSAADMVAQQKALAAMAAIANACKDPDARDAGAVVFGGQSFPVSGRGSQQLSARPTNAGRSLHDNTSGSSQAGVHDTRGQSVGMHRDNRLARAGSPVMDHLLYSRRNGSMNPISGGDEGYEDGGNGQMNNGRDSGLELSTGLLQSGPSNSFSSDNDCGLPVGRMGMKTSDSATDNGSRGQETGMQDMMGSDGVGVDGAFGMGSDKWAGASLVDVEDMTGLDGGRMFSSGYEQQQQQHQRGKQRPGGGEGGAGEGAGGMLLRTGAVAANTEGHVRP